MGKNVEMELCAGNKDTCVLEVDDIDDADIVDSLMDAHPPPGFQVISLTTPVGEELGRWSPCVRLSPNCGEENLAAVPETLAPQFNNWSLRSASNSGGSNLVSFQV